MPTKSKRETADKSGGKSKQAQRVFFALWPDETTRHSIEALTTAAVKESGGNPVPPENFHITLRFLGAVDRAGMKKLKKAAALAFGLPQQIRLDRLGYWENSSIVWLGCNKVHDDLLRLVVNLNTELGGVGFPHENRPFRPHVTLARGAQQAPTTPLSAALEWTSEEFVLVGSTPGPDGSRYEVLERFPLPPPGA